MPSYESDESTSGRGMLFNLKRYSQTRFIRWASRRASGLSQYKLHRKNLYIFPTLTGGAFLLLSVIVWLLGTNYQNNLILALAYLQMSMFVIIILNTYNNLSGVKIVAGPVESICVGEDADFSFTVSGANRGGTHYVNACWRGAVTNQLFDLDNESSQKIYVPCKAQKRGYFCPEFLLLESSFPMGLIRCWTWLQFDIKVLVYPLPICCPLPNTHSQNLGEEEGGVALSTAGGDFFGFSNYQPGDSIKHIAWSVYAKERGLFSKQYGAAQSEHVSLHWDDFFSGNTELCLSNMCYWANQLYLKRCCFSLTLPTVNIPADEGGEHLDKVMKALALFEGKA